MKYFFFDIETIPEFEPHERPQWQLDYAERKAKNKDGTRNEDMEELIFSTDPLLARVLCISYSINEDASEVVYAYTREEEKQILEDFNKVIKMVNVFVGFNSLGFDTPFVLTRMRKLDVKLSNMKFQDMRKFSKSPHYDIMNEFGLYIKRAKLDDYCNYFEIPTPKDDITGAQVHACFKKGEHQRVIDYSHKDTDVLKALFFKATGIFN
jgi:3'-5' exonuclease